MEGRESKHKGWIKQNGYVKKPYEIPLACKLIQRHLNKVIPYVQTMLLLLEDMGY